VVVTVIKAEKLITEGVLAFPNPLAWVSTLTR
jgi:hypothetical protein